MSDAKKESPKDITIELARATTYVAPDLTTIFRKGVPYTMEESLAMEYLGKVDPSGIPYFKRWTEKKAPASDPTLQGEVVKQRGAGGGVRIIRRSVTKSTPVQATEIDTAAHLVEQAEEDADGVDL